MALQWQAAPELEIEYAISLHFDNAEGEGRVYQKDIVVPNTNHSRTDD